MQIYQHCADYDLKKLEKVLPMCCNCKKIQDNTGAYLDADEYIILHTESKVTHGFCPDCIKKLYPEMADEILKKKT